MRHGSFQGRRNNNRHGGRSGGQQGGQHGRQQGGGSNGGGQRPHRNQIFDSNGPEMRVRGTAFQITEKYTALAKDAALSGDIILAENYLQHAEHYQRMINEFEPIQNTPRYESDSNNEGDQESSDASEAPQPDVEAVRVVRRDQNQRRNTNAESSEDSDLGLPSSLFAAPADDRDNAAV